MPNCEKGFALYIKICFLMRNIKLNPGEEDERRVWKAGQSRDEHMGML